LVAAATHHRPTCAAPLLFILALGLALPGLAHADAAGDKVLKILDDNMLVPKDQYLEYDMVTQPPGKSQFTLKMKTYIKGRDKRVIEYTEPGDIKGMKILILSLDQQYVYLPAFRKVRRVAGHVRRQSFQGTAFSQDDGAITAYAPVYDAKLIKETKTHWTVEGKIRPGQDFAYARVVLEISKQYKMLTRGEYYSDKNVHLKTDVRTGFECQGAVCNFKVQRLTDHTLGGLWSENRRTGWKVNTGISDSEFSVRSIQRER